MGSRGQTELSFLSLLPELIHDVSSGVPLGYSVLMPFSERLDAMFTEVQLGELNEIVPLLLLFLGRAVGVRQV